MGAGFLFNKPEISIPDRRTGLGDDFALRTGYEAVAPELDAVGLAGRVGLKTYTVYGNVGQTVGYGVTALYR